ncbi:uncharacterized protein LOC142979368 isoform X1 [Anticarsia gemmatalis]|uniref:uncharacterized protein LOC142979368 isoform X1 n=1 Tax=Anticarsia gemmatalis TaxID=129554 RepID=UPI003F758F99
MVERAGIIIFALWYAAIAFNYYIVPIFEPCGRGTFKCKCVKPVPTPTTPCTCSELSMTDEEGVEDEEEKEENKEPVAPPCDGGGSSPYGAEVDADEGNATVEAADDPTSNDAFDVDEPDDDNFEYTQ